MAGEFKRTVLKTKGVTMPLGTYNHGVIIQPGRLLFIAGQVGVNEHGALAGNGDFAAQTRQVFNNLHRVLVSAGVDFENVAQFTTFLTNSENIPDFYNVRNEVFNTVFPNGDYPPNTLLVINRLVREEFLIEIEAIAGLP